MVAPLVVHRDLESHTGPEAALPVACMDIVVVVAADDDDESHSDPWSCYSCWTCLEARESIHCHHSYYARVPFAADFESAEEAPDLRQTR